MSRRYDATCEHTQKKIKKTKKKVKRPRQTISQTNEHRKCAEVYGQKSE